MSRHKKIHEGPHKYFKATFKDSGTEIFRCGLIDCSHFVYEPLIEGKLSICWRCETAFIIVKKTLRAKKFHCEDCARGRYNKVKDPKQQETTASQEAAIDNILDGIGEHGGKGI